MTGIIAGTAALLGVAFGWWGALIVALATALVLALRSRRLPWADGAVAIVVVVLGAWRAEVHGPRAGIGRLVQDPPTVVVVTAPVFTSQGQYFAVEPRIDDGSSVSRPPARVCVTADPMPVVHLGDAVELHGALEVAADLPMKSRAAISLRGCAGSLYATSVRIIDSPSSVQRAVADLRTGLNATVRRSAPGDAGVLLSGLVTGDDDGLSAARKNAFIRTGTTHLTAVSGSNLALVAGMLATLGSVTIGRHRASWQIMTILSVWAYALISGIQAPSLRAAIVATAAIAAFRVGRRPDFITLILLAAGAMVLLQPRQIETLGFRLSIVASLALALVLTDLTARHQSSRLSIVLTGTVAAQLATLPVLLPAFGTVSLLSVPANIIAVPLAAIAMPLAALAAIAGSFWPPLGEIIAAPAVLAATALIRSVDVLAAPDAYVSIGVPPLPAAAAIAVTVSILLLLIGGNELRGILRSCTKRGPVTRAPTAGTSPPIGRGEHLSQLNSIGEPLPTTGSIESLAPPALVITGEDPFDAFAADPDDAVQNPAGEEVGHELPDERQLGQAILAEVLRQLKEARPAEEPEADYRDQQTQRKQLTALPCHSDVFGAEVIEP
jgi:competence protein ComEC